MQSSESAASADERNHGDGAVKGDNAVIHGKESRFSGRIDDQVWRPAREASVFRPCRLQLLVDFGNAV